MKTDDIKTDGQVKKKFELPLFGKKKTFGLDKLKQVAKVTQSNEKKIDPAASIEEFDDDDEEEATKSTNEPNTISVDGTVAKDCPVVETSERLAESCDEQIKVSNCKVSKENVDTTEKVETIDKIETKIEKKSTAPKIDTDHKPSAPSRSTNEKIPNETNEKSHPETIASTKNKNKNRNRNKIRHQIDIDETEEDTTPQKYSGWMPPSNQSGDGITDLNSKYGY